MKKRSAAITAMLLVFAVIFAMSGCNTQSEQTEDEFVAATVDMGDDVPVSKTQIIDFYNKLLTAVESPDTFTDENKPGVKLSHSLRADSVKVLALDAATGQASESDSLAALNSSAGAIRDRIIGNIPTSSDVVPFGKSDKTIASLIYPYTGVSELSYDDVLTAECSSDGGNINIRLTLEPTAQTAENVFGVRDKGAVIAEFNKYSGEYAQLEDYSLEYVADEENGVYSTISLSVEVAEDDDGEYKCTGRITSLELEMVCDVDADVTCKGSFADAGSVRAQFRFTDEKYYEFDWLGTAEWEPQS